MPKQRTLQWPALCHKKLTRPSKSFTIKPFHSISYIYIRFEATQRLTACPVCSLRGTRWWAGQDSLSKREKPEATKSAQKTRRLQVVCSRCVGRFVIVQFYSNEFSFYLCRRIQSQPLLGPQ